MEVKLVQSLNAKLPIEVKEFGRLMEVIALHL